MKKKNTRLNRIIFLCILTFSLLVINSILTFQSNLFLREESDSLINPDVTRSPSPQESIQVPVGGYSASDTAIFDTIENASSLMFRRDYLANESSYFNINTPQLWNTSSMQFAFEPYSKEQIIEDPYFEEEYENEIIYWDEEKLDRGNGYFTQYNLEDYRYGRTRIYNYRKEEDPGFYQGDYAYWTHEFDNLNPGNVDIKKGRILQEKDEQIENYNYFQTDPNFYKDFDCPYGGDYKNGWDFVDLIYDDSISSLRVIIDPHTSSLGENPSAAWWYFLNIPYEADYAQITLTWSIDDVSTFEAEDEYEVIARINNKYIDGRNPIVKSGEEVPFDGSKRALMVYNNTQIVGHISHNTISRTYNITDLINGLVGINKFDFGVWAKNPSHLGDQDLIIANFESIEIMFNTSVKYEVANLKYRYKLIDDDKTGLNPFKFSNDASLFLFLRDMDTEKSELIRVLPFSITTISSQDYGNTPWISMEFSISHKYQDVLKSNNLEFKIGIYFENDFYDRIYYYHYIDNVFFTINYERTVINPQLSIKIDNSPTWVNVVNKIHIVDTSNWNSSEDHSFQFTTFNASYQNRLYLNFKSDLELYFKSNPPDGAKASYSIQGANSSKGIWDMIYDNSISYSYLLYQNSTPYFNLSTYSISYIDMPAFDYRGSNSANWEISNALSPTSINFTSNLLKFNYSKDHNNQSATLTESFELGNWTLQAYQPNYITKCVLNSSRRYLGLPYYYSDEVLQYNYSIIESTKGDYSIALYNSTGDLMSEFPKHYSANDLNIIGTIDLAEKYKFGKYNLYIEWNDTTSYPGRTLRFGSIIQPFYIINDTKAQFTKLIDQVSSGVIAEFALNYTTYEDWGLENATIIVYENSTGNLKLWGREWTGSYQIGDITYLGNGNYSIPLITDGTPNGTYPLVFVCLKSLNRPQMLSTNLKVLAENIIDFDISEGAFFNISQWIIDSDNIPYVNDTINSVIRINLTESGTPIEGGLIIGNIGESEYYFKAQEIGGGLYDLTLNTTGFNATQKIGNKYIENETLELKCSAGGYNVKDVNVTILIDKIPTQITMQNVDTVYVGGSITATSTMINKIDPYNPKPNNRGNLSYYIYQGSSKKLNGSLDLLLNGVYQKSIALSDLSAGNYSIYINGTAFNCEKSQSNIVNFTILPQETTNLSISVPSNLRISKEFQIETTLNYAINGSPIQDQTVFLNISTGQAENFVVSTTTDAEGISTYKYIIPMQYENQNMTIEAFYEGKEKIEPSKTSVTKKIYGKIPIDMEIYEYPNVLRVGYPAKYGLRLNISESGETLQNRIILFSAYYNEELSTPFVIDQLYTDENGQCEYTVTEIGNKNNNITVFFEYLGSTTISYNITSKTDLIEPKWISNFTVDPLPSIIRYGQIINFDTNFYCENSSISLENLPVSLIFEYGGKIESYTELLDINNTLFYSYHIADSFIGNLDCSILFEGTNRIKGYSLNYSLIVNPKVQINLEFIEIPKTQYKYGTYTFQIKVSNELGENLDGLLIFYQLLDKNNNEISNYTAICENGIAVGTLDLKVGDGYSIQVQFFAESYYESASISSHKIRVVNEFIIFLDLLPYILVAIGVVIAVSFLIYYGVVVPKRRRGIESMKKLYQKFSDVENLQYVLILTKDGGVPCFSKSLADVPIDETLVSGFLSAISSFGKEIGSKIQESEGGLEELSYRQFKIILNEGNYVKVAILLLKRPSETLKENLRKFNEVFEEVYEERLKQFTGEVFEDIPITKMIEEVFEADLLYPHQVIETKVEDFFKSSKSKSVDKKIIIIVRGEEFESNFYLRDLINHLKIQGIEDIKSFESIQKMKLEKIVFAINPRTNYLIEEFRKYIKLMNLDDKNVLFAVFDGSKDIMSIRKYLSKRDITLSTDIDQIIEKLIRLKLVNELNQITEIGSAVATLSKLIPEL